LLYVVWVMIGALGCSLYVVLSAAGGDVLLYVVWCG